MNKISVSDLQAHTILVAMDELRKATSKSGRSEALDIINETDRALRAQLPRQAVSVKVNGIANDG